MTTHTVDTFGGSSIDLGSHTPDSGGPWVNIDADTNHLKTSGSNSLNATTTTNNDGSYAVDVGSADMYAEMTLGSFTQIPTNGLGLAVRISDKSNFYGISRASTSACSVLKRVGGSFTVFNSTLSIPNRSAGDLIRIEIVGTTLTIYNNGTSIYSTTDSSLSTSTKAGFYTHNTTAGTNILTKFEADAVGSSGNTLSISATESPDTAAVTLHLTNRVSAAIQEAGDTLAATVHLADRISAALQEGADTLAATIHLTDRLAIAATESPDVFSATLTVATSRSLSAALVESADTLAATLHLTDRLAAALVESADVLAATIHVTNRISAALTEGADVLSATIFTQPSRSLSAAIVEQPDSALMTFYPLYLESVPFFDGAGFSDGSRFRQVRRRQFVTTPSEGDEWTNLNPTGDPWTQTPDSSNSWNSVN